MEVLNSLGPVLFLIGLGSFLYRSRFFSEAFFKDLNRLCYYWGLPSLLVYQIAKVELWSEEGTGILYTMLIVIFLTIAIAYACVPLLKVQAHTIGAFVQGCFRGNLAFVGFPVVFFALGESGLQLGMFASGFCILVYNVLAVLILLLHSENNSQNSWRTVWRYGFSNPLILACLVGFLINLSGLEIPVVFGRTLSAFGQIAMPLALIALGAGLRIEDLRGSLRLSVIAALINVGLSPVLGFAVGLLLGLDEQSLKIAVIFMACPTAVFSYVIAEMLGNDAVTARNIVILSTIFCIITMSLAVALLSSF
jgi:predicted permease